MFFAFVIRVENVFAFQITKVVCGNKKIKESNQNKMRGSNIDQSKKENIRVFMENPPEIRLQFDEASLGKFLWQIALIYV